MATLECKSVQRGVPSKWVDVAGITDRQVQDAHKRLDALVKSTNPSKAVAGGFLAVVEECPTANPSDLWQHIIYRHLLDEGWSDNKWKRVSGFALELALVEAYNPRLAPFDIRMKIMEAEHANKFLRTLGTNVTATKVDIFLLQRENAEEWSVFGAAHVKSSIAERIQDDVPASEFLMKNNLLSIMLTMDSKSYPPPHGECVNFGELGGRSVDVSKARIKRDYIEKTGQFSALFSFNLRTPPSPEKTPSGRRIYTMGFHDKQPDQLVHFLSASLAS